MDIVLYSRKSHGYSTSIYAEYTCGKLTITKHLLNPPDDEYGIDESESFTNFNEWHTAKLMKALEVETPGQLLHTLKKKFHENGIDFNIDNRIREFCDKHEVKYRTQTYY